MSTETVFSMPECDRRYVSPRYCPGNLVKTVGADPTVYEVIGVDDDGRVHLRGVDWAPGYSAWVAASEVRPTTAQWRDD